MSVKLRVLLLENSRDDALIVEREIRTVADVEVASNKEAFKRLLPDKWSAILVDLALPGFDGREAIKMAREQHRRTPIIIVTGSVNGREADAACEAGACRFILKDVTGVPGLARAVVQAHETEQLEAQSERDNRLEILGHTTAGYTHDLNNLLQVFASGPEILRKLLDEHLKHPLPEAIERVLSAMESTGQRGSEMSRQITAFVRGTNGGQFKDVKADFLLTELGAMLRASFPKNLRITLHTMPGTSPVRCDHTQIVQLLLNLCVNARDAMPLGGELTVTAQNTTLLVDRRNDPPLTGDFVVFQVRDTGSGIKEEWLPRIWEPFWTTKEIGMGTGLGLPMARKIARDHRGDIDVRTGDAGTSFFVYLPIAVEETRAEKMDRLEEFDGQGQTILIVDDEAHMRMLLEMILRDANYKTIVAISGFEALSMFRSNANIKLLLTDVSMPLFNGVELASTLRGQNYDLPIIFLTGSMGTSEFDPMPQAVLKKPFSCYDLLSALKRVMASSDA